MDNIKNIEEYIKNSKYYSSKNIDIKEFSSIITEKILLTKDDIRNNYFDILSEEYKYLKIDSLNISRSSGSTGEPVLTYWKSEDLMASNLCLWRLRKKYYGISPCSRRVSFHSILYDNATPVETKKIMYIDEFNLSFSKFELKDKDLFEYYQELMKFKPEWIYAQPSIVKIFIEFMKKHDLKFNGELKLIELNGEILDFEMKRQIEEFSQVKVANLYGATEVNAIAYECPWGHMHIVSDNITLQLYNASKDESGYMGNVVVSSLHNSSFPILGYLLNDKVHVNLLKKCGCSNHLPIIDEIYGREGRSVQYLSGQIINEYLITRCVEDINAALGNPVLQYKSKILKDEFAVVLDIVIKENYIGWKRVIAKEIVNRWNELIDLKIDDKCIKFVDNIKFDKNGKHSILEVI